MPVLRAIRAVSSGTSVYIAGDRSYLQIAGVCEWHGKTAGR